MFKILPLSSLTDDPNELLLCPVRALEHFLHLSRNASGQKLFINPSSLVPVTINKLRWYLCKLIKLSNPGVFPRVHEIRKMAASFSFFNQMSTSEILSLAGWRSIRIFKKHYLVDIQAISNNCVVFGKPLDSIKSSSDN